MCAVFVCVRRSRRNHLVSEIEERGSGTCSNSRTTSFMDPVFTCSCNSTKRVEANHYDELE